MKPSEMIGSHYSLGEIEKLHILGVLESVSGHKKKAADILDLNPSTLYRKLLRYGINTGNDETVDFDQEVADELDIGNVTQPV